MSDSFTTQRAPSALRLLVLLASCAFAAPDAARAAVFNVKSHGAIGDGVAMDTAAVQRAIDACHEAGGGTVRVPAGEFQIGTVRLKSNVTLSLDHGASLLGSTNLADYPTKGLRAAREGNSEGSQMGSIQGVRISDVVAKVTIQQRGGTATDRERAQAGPIMIAGIPGHNVKDVVLENINVSFAGGGTAEDAKRVVPEDIARYPEHFFFGVLPSWGAYIRHARNVTFKNVELRTRAPNQRERIVLEDAEGFIER